MGCQGSKNKAKKPVKRGTSAKQQKSVRFSKAPPRELKRMEEINLAEAILLVKTLKFDFNQGDDKTMEDMFAKHFTNDLGIDLQPQSVHILFSEFRKFLWLSAMEIKYKNRTGSRVGCQVEGSTQYILSPYSASPAIDRVWQFLIQFSHSYEQLCQHLVGARIDRPEPSFTKYNAFLAK